MRIDPSRLRAPARRLAVLASTVLGLTALAASAAHAQVPTTGSVRGVVTDAASGAPVPGAVVSVRGPALQSQAGAITEGDGSYEITGLPPGLYTLTVYQGDALLVSRSNVLVRLGKVSRVDVDVRMAGEVIEITGRAPLIDQGSTKTGVTVTADYVRNVPIGRNFDEVLDLAPGAQRDEFGTGFGGSTSPENSYVIEGLNVTGVGFGLATLTLPTEFVREIEVVSGAYGAEFGRATGGIANVVTRSGSNDLHGSVFGYFTPGALTGQTRFLPNENSSIVFQRDLAYRGDFGAEVGGPLIPDTLWFHAGLSPSLQSLDADRVVTRFRDANGDGLPDRDGGTIRYDELDRRTIDVPARTYYFTGKLSYAASPEHGGSLAVFGNPGSNDLVFDDFAVGPDQTLLFEERTGVLAGVARWTSRLFDGDGQLEATLGIHRGQDEQRPKLPGGDDQSFRFQETRPLGDFTMFEDVPAGCMDGGEDDPFPDFVNCPVTNYQVGGIDVFSQTESQRIGGALAYGHIFDALGRHRVKVGVDFEDNRFDARAAFSGGARWWNIPGLGPARFRFLQPDDNGDIPCGLDTDGDFVPDGLCSAGALGRVADTRTLNLGAFVQDSWTILPNLTVEAGLRFERQAVGAAREVVGEIDPYSGQRIDEVAFALNNVAPRAGVIYDWTNQGRSRMFAHWGRYFESIPMDLNARGLSGEIIDVAIFDPSTCADPFQPAAYGCTTEGFLGGQQFGGGKLVSPNLRGQYMDELVAGVEYEPLPDLKVGATYIHRELGRVIEDVSHDGGNTYVLANPGEVDAGAVADLRAQAEAARAVGDMAEAANLDRIATAYEGVGRFDRPRRVYDALELSLTKRFSQRVMARASYTYARLRGNFAGLFSPDTNQLDPNFTTVYDLPELVMNRNGALPGDRPHQLKLDAYYELPVTSVGNFVLGGRVRGASGRPHNHLGNNFTLNSLESFILPRGSGERPPFTTAFDVHLAYGRPLSDDLGLELFVSVFNVFNQQGTLRRDEIYTFDEIVPIEGGDAADLAHAKNKNAPGQAVAVNPNFDNPTEVQAPISVRFGARVTF